MYQKRAYKLQFYTMRDKHLYSMNEAWDLKSRYYLTIWERMQCDIQYRVRIRPIGVKRRYLLAKNRYLMILGLDCHTRDTSALNVRAWSQIYHKSDAKFYRVNIPWDSTHHQSNCSNLIFFFRIGHSQQQSINDSPIAYYNGIVISRKSQEAHFNMGSHRHVCYYHCE